ncbi:MAG TPA: MoaD/ThiS family protein [Capillimicrobium sp.]|nr:MoaD/ThiS family protein [Capillimicrobium sp.]
MPTVRLHGPMVQRAGGVAEHAVDGATVAELLRGLEGAQPALRGWILDERGRLRRHLCAFVAGQDAREETAVAPGDRVDVVQAISGG